MSKPSKLDEDKGIVYCNRVLLGNWYEASQLEEFKYLGHIVTPDLRDDADIERERRALSVRGNMVARRFARCTKEVKITLFRAYCQTFYTSSLWHRLGIFRNQMEKGDLMLARYRKMTENLNAPTALTQSTGTIAFGDNIAFLAPHVSASDTPSGDSKGVFLGGRISADDIMYSQDLRDGCAVVAHNDLKPMKKHTFVITSADYCDREHEVLKYNQEFLLTLAKSVKNKPLYIRFDPNPIPGLCGKFPLYLSEHAVSNTRWRVLPVQSPNITRFEQEGKPVPTNEDIVINHCSTNLNLGVDTSKGGMGFYGKIYAPLMKTCLDVYGRELPNNIWQIHIPAAK